jgi:hypothetical protein
MMGRCRWGHGRRYFLGNNTVTKVAMTRIWSALLLGLLAAASVLQAWQRPAAAGIRGY